MEECEVARTKYFILRGLPRHTVSLAQPEGPPVLEGPPNQHRALVGRKAAGEAEDDFLTPGDKWPR